MRQQRHVLLHSSSNVHRKKLLKTISAHKYKQLYTIDGPFCQSPIVHIDANSVKSNSHHETYPRCREERQPRNSKQSSGDFSASHLAVTGLVKKSASWSAVPTFTTFNTPLLTLSCILQDPGKSVPNDDGMEKPVEPSRSDYLQKDYGLSLSSQEWKSGAAEHDRSGKLEVNSWDSLQN